MQYQYRPFPRSFQANGVTTMVALITDFLNKATSMTPDMKFEALLVSRNLHTPKGVLETLEDFSIDVDICMSSMRAVDVLSKLNVDLVVIDCENNGH
jgi:hypothetical protein